MKKFIYSKPFKIIQSDKNIGTAIVSNDLHNQLCSKHLNDTNIYHKLNYNPLNETNAKIKYTKLNIAKFIFRT